MPRDRLEWFKFWERAIDHPKIALLPDGLFRTWVHVLAAGSQQPVRWHFASARHAAKAAHRPVKHIRQLITARLIDTTDGEAVVVHDWRQWQHWESQRGRDQLDGKNRNRTGRSLKKEEVPTVPKKEERKKEETLPTGLQTTPAGERETGVTPGDAPVSPPANGKISGDETPLTPLWEAFDALGLERPKLPGFEPTNAWDLLREYPPETIAACWQDIASGEWGSDFDRARLSFKLLASHNRIGNWQREREAALAPSGADADIGMARRV